MLWIIAVVLTAAVAAGAALLLTEWRTELLAVSLACMLAVRLGLLPSDECDADAVDEFAVLSAISSVVQAEHQKETGVVYVFTVHLDSESRDALLRLGYDEVVIRK